MKLINKIYNHIGFGVATLNLALLSFLIWLIIGASDKPTFEFYNNTYSTYSFGSACGYTALFLIVVTIIRAFHLHGNEE